MITDALVSIVVPTRNRRVLLARALASIQSQTHTRWEALIMDDGSQDGTAQMVAELNDERMRFFSSQYPSGSGNARWRGAREARGDYIAYLDSDDYWLPSKLERQLTRAHACNCADVVVLCPPLTLRDGELFKASQPPLGTGEPISERRVADYVYASADATLQTSGFLVSGELGRRVCFDPELRVNQDTDYVLRLAAAGACFAYLDEHLYVQDTNDRGDRISTDQSLLKDSLNWFQGVSGNWSPAARRGYYFIDASIRSARQDRPDLGIWYYLRGFDLRRSRYFLLHQLMCVLGRGEVPTRVRQLGRWAGISRGQRTTL